MDFDQDYRPSRGEKGLIMGIVKNIDLQLDLDLVLVNLDLDLPFSLRRQEARLYVS